MSKKFFIIPGFKMTASHKSFSWLTEYLAHKGYSVLKVPVDWRYTTISDNAQEFKDFFNKNKGAINYILGFSYGAVIAFITANELSPNKLFLCSLSPTFSEDRAWERKWIKYIGKRRYEDSLGRSSLEIARVLRIPSVLFCGEKEAVKYPALIKRSKEVSQKAAGSKLVMVKGAPHQIDFLEYIEAIKREIEAL
ncbi:MAG: alpha/beta hydrolase [Candidatus Paceibacterota bacterium]|jgi:pimeloyl-ACP methyl ester carboxylesterase